MSLICEFKSHDMTIYCVLSNLQIASFNNKVIPDTIQGESGVCWSDVSENPEILIGEQARVFVSFCKEF